MKLKNVLLIAAGAAIAIGGVVVLTPLKPERKHENTQGVAKRVGRKFALIKERGVGPLSFEEEAIS